MVRIQGILHLVLHILTTCLHLDMALSIRESHLVLFWIAISAISASSLVGNTASLIMVYRNMDFTGKRTGEFICVFFHLVQLGPVWRYLKLLVTRDQNDVTELSQLRLCHSVIQDGILFVIEVFIILTNIVDIEVVSMMTVIFALVSMSFSYSCVSSQCNVSQIGTNDSNFIIHNKKLPINFTTVLEGIGHGAWHFFSLQARMLSFTLFFTTTHVWAILAPALHLLFHYAIIYVNLYLNPIKQSPQCKEIIKNLLVGYTQMFDHLGKTHEVCTSCVYFIVVSFENVFMITTWFISTEKSSLNTGLFVYVFLCHVVGTLVGTIVNQTDARKSHISRHSSVISNRPEIKNVSNAIAAISSKDKDTVFTGIDFDTVIEYIGDNEEIQSNHESKIKKDKLPFSDNTQEERLGTLEDVEIMKHLIFYNRYNTHNDTSGNEVTIVPPLEPQIHDHESSNSRNTNTLISSISSTIKDPLNGNESYVHQGSSTNRTKYNSKVIFKWKNDVIRRPLPEPLWQHGESMHGKQQETQESSDRLERKWRSFSNSPHDNILSNGKGKPLHLPNRYHGATVEDITNKHSKRTFVKNPHKKANNKHTNTRSFPNVTFNTVVPNRKSKQGHRLWTHLDWDVDIYTAESSTTDNPSLPPSRQSEVYETCGVFSSQYTDKYYAHRWRDTCSTCSSTDYFDLDGSEYGETWTWPPSKPGITRESINGLSHDKRSSRDTVTKWLCNIPDEHFV